MYQGPVIQNMLNLTEWLAKVCFSLYLEYMVICCHWTCHRANSLPQNR